MRRASTQIVSACSHIQKARASSAAALARKWDTDPPAITQQQHENWPRRSRSPNTTWKDPSSSASGSRVSQGPSSMRSSSGNSPFPREWSRPSRPADARQSEASTRQVTRPYRPQSSNGPVRNSVHPEAWGSSMRKDNQRPQSANARVRAQRSSVDLSAFKEVVNVSEEADDHYGSRSRGTNRRPLQNAHHRHPRNPGHPSSQAGAGKALQKKKKPQLKPMMTPKNAYIPNTISVGNLSRILNVKIKRLEDIMYNLDLGSANFDRVITSDAATLIAIELGFNPIVNDDAAFDIFPEPSPVDRSSLPGRPPIVTIMGHVDHGKTTLLDTLRSASVAAGESGGITQHIGAFSVPLNAMSVKASESDKAKSVTFLDTPGHSAFSAMRARGANVTDIIVLVVAADDGIMPQTREVIQLAQKEQNVQMIVAINKCDKPGVDASEVKNGLLGEGVEIEEIGGNVPCVEVSGLTGKGLDDLLETIITMAEISDLRAEKNLRAHGHVLEARMEKGRGAVATVLVRRGTLKRGDCIIAGQTFAKVRQMTDDKGKAIDAACPGMPVTVTGWKDVPTAGDEVLSAEGKKAADDVKRAVQNRIREKENASLLEDVECINEKRRIEKQRRDEIAATTVIGTFTRHGAKIGAQVGTSTAASAYAQNEQNDGVKELRVLVKADVSGTLEAVIGSISGIGNKIAKVTVVSSGVGDVTEADVNVAAAAQASILGFNINVPRPIESAASQSDVPLHIDSVIYRLIETVTEKVTDLLPRIVETRVVGEATVQQLFSISKKKELVKVAGCRIVNGQIEKHGTVRVVRKGETVGQGTVIEMRHLKDEVNEVRKGMECGLRFDTFDDFKEGDLIQAYETDEKAPTL